MKWFLICLIFYVAAAGLSKYWSNEAAFSQAIAQQRGGGLTPIDPYHCPASHVIKDNFTTDSGERCITHAAGGRFYEKTKPAKCYASSADAITDGCRSSLK